MADCIIREAAIDAIWKPEVRPNALIFDALRRACEEEVKHIPAADVRPVVHGRWIVTDYGDYQLIECDQCHAQMWNHQSELPNYCYECGADMRKAVEIDQVKEDEQ